jgi:hypothetical protein
MRLSYLSVLTIFLKPALIGEQSPRRSHFYRNAFVIFADLLFSFP